MKFFEKIFVVTLLSGCGVKGKLSPVIESHEEETMVVAEVGQGEDLKVSTDLCKAIAGIHSDRDMFRDPIQRLYNVLIRTSLHRERSVGSMLDYFESCGESNEQEARI
jgi:hypothetical protein